MVEFSDDQRLKKLQSIRNINIILIAVLVIACVGFLSYFFSQGSQCTQQPFIYGAQQISEMNDGRQTTCSCNVGSAQPFCFTNKENSFESPCTLNPLDHLTMGSGWADSGISTFGRG